MSASSYRNNNAYGCSGPDVDWDLNQRQFRRENKLTHKGSSSSRSSFVEGQVEENGNSSSTKLSLNLI